LKGKSPEQAQKKRSRGGMQGDRGSRQMKIAIGVPRQAEKATGAFVGHEFFSSL
jgi:hypothetical protein